MRPEKRALGGRAQACVHQCSTQISRSQWWPAFLKVNSAPKRRASICTERVPLYFFFCPCKFAGGIFLVQNLGVQINSLPNSFAFTNWHQLSITNFSKIELFTSFLSFFRVIFVFHTPITPKGDWGLVFGSVVETRSCFWVCCCFGPPPETSRGGLIVAGVLFWTFV